jgi:hypothetical protein
MLAAADYRNLLKINREADSDEVTARLDLRPGLTVDEIAEAMRKSRLENVLSREGITNFVAAL